MIVEEKQALVFIFVDPDQPIRHLDLFLRPELSYESLLPDSEWVRLSDCQIRIVNRRRLLAIKLAIQPPRTKDALDIEFLRRHAHE